MSRVVAAVVGVLLVFAGAALSFRACKNDSSTVSLMHATPGACREQRRHALTAAVLSVMLIVVGLALIVGGYG